MPQYECAVVLVPTLSDEQVPEQIEQMKGWLTALGAQVTETEVWGRKRLAFPIRKFQEGFYVIYYFTLAEGQARLTEFERRANTTESILRQLIIRLPALKRAPRLKDMEAEGESRAREAPAEGEAPAAGAEQTEAAGAELTEAAVAPEAEPSTEPAAKELSDETAEEPKREASEG